MKKDHLAHGELLYLIYKAELFGVSLGHVHALALKFHFMGSTLGPTSPKSDKGFNPDPLFIL